MIKNDEACREARNNEKRDQGLERKPAYRRERKFGASLLDYVEQD